MSLTQQKAKTWTPILEGAQRDRARDAARAIGQRLRTELDGDRSGSLAGGAAGSALFFAYLGHTLGDDSAPQTAAHLISQALQSETRSVSLYSGFTGIAWTLQHLTGFLIDVGDSDPNDAVDLALLDVLRESTWDGEYDLIDGLVGIGVYALERWPRPSASAILHGVIEHLVHRAERTPDGATWFSPVDQLPEYWQQQFPRGAYNLGLAHGTPGVIGLLGKACAIDGIRDAARPLLGEAVSWLLQNRLPAGGSSAYAAAVAPDVSTPPARSAWCYGDPGIAAALLVAARHAAEPQWEQSAMAIAELAAGRPMSECGVVDSGICHGAAGLAHIFNRLYQATGRTRFRRAALLWLQHVLEARIPARTDFLEGAAGVGLVLLSSATSVEPAWDRALLVDCDAVH